MKTIEYKQKLAYAILMLPLFTLLVYCSEEEKNVQATDKSQNITPLPKKDLGEQTKNEIISSKPESVNHESKEREITQQNSLQRMSSSIRKTLYDERMVPMPKNCWGCICQHCPQDSCYFAYNYNHFHPYDIRKQQGQVCKNIKDCGLAICYRSCCGIGYLCDFICCSCSFVIVQCCLCGRKDPCCYREKTTPPLGVCCAIGYVFWEGYEKKH